MIPFQELTEFAPADIQALIADGVEQSIHLDFKAAPALDKNEKKKEEIAKDVSSFANSDGGIIVYGITEKNHCADSLSFIDGNAFTKEWLEQIINSKINKKIEGVQIFPVRFDNDVAKTVYVVKIPRSSSAPHMSSDNRYYRRYNFNSVPMEEYEVRDLFYRKNKSHLRISNYFFIKKDHKRDDDKCVLEFNASIENIGTEVETLYKLNIYLTDESKLKFYDLSWEPTKDNMNYSLWHNGLKISAIGSAPLFPDETIDIARFSMSIEKEKYQALVANTKVRVLLLYTGGYDEKTISLSELMSKE